MKTKLAAIMVASLAMSPLANAATGIQIDPTGSGNISKSTVFGNDGFAELSLDALQSYMLFSDCAPGPSVEGTSSSCHLYGEGVIQVPDAPHFNTDALLLFTFDLAVDLLADDLTPNNLLHILSNTNTAGSFSLEFDSDGTGGSLTNIATGALEIEKTNSDPTGSFNLSTNLASSGAINDETGAPDTVTFEAAAAFDIGVTFASINELFIVNEENIVGEGLELDSLALNAPFEIIGGEQAPFPTTVDGVTVDIDGDNDWTCSGGPTDKCDIIVSLGGTLSSAAASIPEPATLALTGLALGGIGFLNRRRRRT